MLNDKIMWRFQHKLDSLILLLSLSLALYLYSSPGKMMLKRKHDNTHLNKPKIILICKIKAQNECINADEMHRWNINSI